MGCARCHGALAKSSHDKAAKVEEVVSPTTAPDPLRTAPALDDWNLDHDLAAVTRIMQTMRAEGASPPRESASAEYRSPAWLAIHPAHTRVEHQPIVKQRGKRSNVLAWPMLMLGMMSFACGAVLLCWSFVTGRGDLWTYGMPAVLAGQGLLVLGLVLQLDGLWQNNRDTHETLSELDRELSELRHATTMLTTSQSSAGQSFYAHMAEGASPNLLLADVKGQLDLIAARLAKAKER